MDIIKSFEQFVNESLQTNEAARVPSNILDFAKKKGSYATSLVKKAATWAEKAGKYISGGTAIGKDYMTIILDMKHQGSEIYINLNDETIELFGEEVTDAKSFQKVLDANSTNESLVSEGTYQQELRAIHFETDPKKQEDLKAAYGKTLGEVSRSKQIEAANYMLKKFRKEIKYDNGSSGPEGSLDVFIPSSSMAAFSTLGNGPHAKIAKAKSWNQRSYDKWIKDVSGNGGAEHAYDMAQNAKNEPGLIDWVKKNNRGENPLDIIQWDIEAYS